MKTVIYIIDDDPIVQYIISKLIGKVSSNCDIICCDNGKIGLDLILSSNTLFEKIIVFLDINMPIMDGWGFLDSITNEASEIRGKLNINIITSSTDKEDINRAKTFSIVNRFFHKPITFKDIQLILPSS